MSSPSPFANGNAVQQRHQFRRQNSSYGGGHVHNMAVMVAPSRLDYSVTKGGLKTWAVLIVFFLLCSALLAVFSEQDENEIRDNFVEQTVGEVEEEVETADVDPQPPDEAEEDDDDSEETLFAALRAKAANFAERLQRKRRPIIPKAQKAVVKEEEPEEEEEEPEEEEERAEEEVEEEEEVNDVEEEENEEDEEEEERNRLIALRNKRSRQRRLEKKRTRQQREQEEEEKGEEKENEEENEEEEQPEEEEPEEEEEEEEEQQPEEEEPEKEIQKEEKKETPKPKEEKLNEETENTEEDEEAVIELFLPRQLRNPKRRSGLSWFKSIQAQQMAEDGRNPRMSLLKGRNKKFYPKLKEPLVGKEPNNNKEEQNREEEEENGETRDIVATRKRSGYYSRKAITSRADYKFRSQLDSADFLLEKHDFAEAISEYRKVVEEYRESPRAHFGIGRAHALMSEFSIENSDSLLDVAIEEYQRVLECFDTPDELFRLAAEHLIESARFRGNLHKVMTVQRELVDRFPEDIHLQTDFGITFLMMGRPEDARSIFTAVLETEPHNGVALAYYGYLLKVNDQDYEKGVHFMRRGIRSQSEPISDPKFYFHLGDALERLGRSQEALRVYEDAVELGVFPSAYQRSTYNLDGLSARPWWSLAQTHCSRHLKNIERQWTVIREEALKVWNEDGDLFVDENPHLTDGVQRALYIRSDDSFIEKSCQLLPATCSVLKSFVEESNCDKGDIKISVLLPGTRIWPHCGPTNYILNAQLGLVSPSEARIRVEKEIRGWKTGKFLVFDESFEHELWFEGAASTAIRIVLTMELWHPEVPLNIRSSADNS